MAKITRKAFVRKKIIGFAIGFTAVTLVAVGVSAIALTANTNIDKETSIIVGTVDADGNFFVKQETRVHVTDDQTSLSYPVYRFEPAEDDHEGRVRCVDVSEVLSLTVDATIEHAERLSSITAMVMCKDVSNDDRIQRAVEKGYIELPEAFTYNETELPVYNAITGAPITSCFHIIQEAESGAGKTLKFGYDVAFKWGSAFRYMNPSLYFDLDDVKDTIPTGDKFSPSGSNTVVGILNDLRSLLTGIQLNLWLTAK